MRPSGRAPALLVLPALLAALVAVLPIGYLVVRTSEAGADRIVGLVLRPQTLALIGRSLGLVASVSVLSLIIGVSLAVLVARTDVPGRRLLSVLAPLPLAIPSYVAAFAWISAFPAWVGWAGATTVLTLCCYPYVYLPVLAALRRTDPAVEEVARALGRTPTQAFRSVTLPRLWPSATAGGLLVALYTLSDFGAVSILRHDVFTRVIHTSYTASFDRTPAAVLGLLLVAITVLIAWGESRVRTRDVTRVGGGSARLPERHALGGVRWVASGTAYAVVALALIFPLSALTYWFAAGRSSDLDVSSLVSALGSTVWLATLGAVACTAGAVPLAVLVVRHRSQLSVFLDQATYAGHALPGLVVALALVFFGIRVVPWLYQESLLLVAAYVALFLPIAGAAVRSAVALSTVRTEEVARTLGASPMGVIRRVTLPLAAPGIAAGAALVLLTCMKELPATLLLRPTGTDTLATRLWTETGVGAYGAAAPYGVALVLLAVIPTVALMWFNDRPARRPRRTP